MDKKQKPTPSKKEIKKQLESSIITALEGIVSSTDKKIKKLIKKSAKVLADSFQEQKEKPTPKKNKSAMPAETKAAKKKTVKKSSTKKSAVKKSVKK